MTVARAEAAGMASQGGRHAPIDVPLSAIGGLSAGLVPHRSWPLRQWFLADSRRYYHGARRSDRAGPGASHYELMDPCLRELCRLLHGIGIATTPSCQGHDHDRGYFESRWEALRDEAHIIRGPGLRVTDSLGGRPFRFRDAHYTLPWASFVQFLHASRAQQSTGYLGMIVPFAAPDLNRRLLQCSARLGTLAPEPDHRRSPRVGGHLYHLAVCGRNDEERGRRWRMVTEWVRNEMIVTPR